METKATETFNNIKRRIGIAIKVLTKEKGDLSFSTLLLVFLKYAIDNHIGAKTFEDMEFFLRAQMALVSNNIDEETIIKVLKYVEDKYAIEGILTNEEVIEEYKSDLITNVSSKKNLYSTKHFNDVIEELSKADFKDDASFTIGKEIVEAFKVSLGKTAKGNLYSSSKISEWEISKLATELLKIKENDIFLDFASGTSLSTIEIVKDKEARIINIDNDKIVCSVGAMILILSGINNFKIICNDGISKCADGIIANKIFIDYIDAKNSEVMRPIDRILEGYLDFENEGRAIATITPGFLASGYKQVVEYKKKLVESGKLTAVIMFSHCPLFIIGKNDSRTIKFISSDDINEICEAWESDTEVKGVSAIKSISDFCTVDENGKYKDFNFLPSIYIDTEAEESRLDKSVVEAELRKCYEQLKIKVEYPIEAIDRQIEELFDQLKK